MSIIEEEFPLFPSEEDNSEEWYADIYKKTNLTKEELEIAHKDSIEESKELYIEANSDDLLDLDLPVAMPLYGGLHSIRNADIREDKLYLDEEKENVRYSYINKQDGNPRNEAVILLKSDENRLSEIITQLPYGLIDKQATGIGATHLELHCSKRDSIIVVPTRALGEGKCGNNPNFLYVGTQRGSNDVTTNTEIKNYINNSGIEFKKIVVVADSLKRVINNFQELGIDVYREYFLMVDEIDTIQADAHYRPQLSNVIDYYFKFKLQRRALVSATVKEFSHPKLQGEPLTTIKKEVPIRRNITLLHTNNINELLVEEILRISSSSPEEKILIAYNSLTDIQSVITRLPTDIRNRCGILCSETNYRDDRIEQQYRAEIDSEDELSHEIVFMTCAYFAGLDMKDTFHLITITSVQYSYTILPINKMTQIHGRCRIDGGILSDTIIYSTLKDTFYYFRNYRDTLKLKATRIIEYLNASKELQGDFNDLEDIFNRIEPLIMDEASEAVFKGKPIALTRKNILNHKFEISYFNIDILYEQMYSYSRLYSSKNMLHDALIRDHNIESFNDRQFAQEIQELTRGISNEDKILRVQNCIDDLTTTLATIEADTVFNSDSQFARYLEGKVKISRTFEKEAYYSRVNELYKYIDINLLNQKLLEICTKDIRAYRSFKNATCFYALMDDHPFKQLIKSNFVVGRRYSSDKIKEKLDIIVTDQLLIRSNQSRARLVGFFTSILDFTYTSGLYIVNGYMPKMLRVLGVSEPLNRIPVNIPSTKIFKL